MMSNRVTTALMTTGLLFGSLPGCERCGNQQADSKPSPAVGAATQPSDSALAVTQETEAKLPPPPLHNFKTVRFSNGLVTHLCYEITSDQGVPVYRIDTGYGRDYDIMVYDPGDGKPYIYEKTEDGGLQKRFQLTYRFVDGGPEYPIWEPTAFRSDPGYGKISSKP